ncbi:hypothetical protein BX616_001646 [Lobosporangium transversale]|uniref:Uncharacterized protein n=1 Tax=Lobosporangium transversale TaxID=64571 RepID=A0A1Y2GFW5_9FUNG|nr:hypothetical protein BCR41DRAFT_359008 [Lobosporangium transversale]KAF9917215.1 hypothetical protein BX616_001646 [Lobosporangium transversale]ORZ08779.1 hypothetical protein BCR41DRAFT_359008 [Lobosporangium transversale]|eukprot:XP_021878562.1 hypothetical protein BCR41DRAFT_359008 [Lobosporangium transversale]
MLSTVLTPQPNDTRAPHYQENIFCQAWHSFEEAIHLRGTTPPPVPPKDERWVVKTANLAILQAEIETETDVDHSIWDKIIQRITATHNHTTNEEANQNIVSIDVPAEAALRRLGVQEEDSELQNKKNYFKRMAVRCKEKFEEDGSNISKHAQLKGGIMDFTASTISVAQSDNENEDEDSNGSQPSHDPNHSEHHHRHQLRQYLHALHLHFLPYHVGQRQEQEREQNQTQFVPKVDLKGMKAAHQIIYNTKEDHREISSDSEGRTLFGLWWDWCPKRSKAEKQIEEDLDSEWEIIDVPKNKKEKIQSLCKQDGVVSAHVNDQKTWWKHKSLDTDALIMHSKSGYPNDRKAAAKRRQAIAAAAAYEAVKEYHAHKSRKGKKVSHGEMKAVLAGMAMAEAVKLLESRHSEDGNERDETVAEAGSCALKLFELLR